MSEQKQSPVKLTIRFAGRADAEMGLSGTGALSAAEQKAREYRALGAEVEILVRKGFGYVVHEEESGE